MPAPLTVDTPGIELSLIAQLPHRRHLTLIAWALLFLARVGRQCRAFSVHDSGSDAHSALPPSIGRSHADALVFAPCQQTATEIAPAPECRCRAKKKPDKPAFLFDRPRFPGALRFAVGRSDEDEVAAGQAATLRGQTENADFMHRLGEVGSAAGECTGD